MGYFCVDNLPPILLPKFVDLLKQSTGKLQKVALVIDLRGREFFTTFLETLKSIEKNQDTAYQVIFLDASDQTLVKRYKETRRRHPLSPQGTPLEGIRKERQLLEKIKGRAHHIVDTSHLIPIQLKEKLIQWVSTSEEPRMSITFMTFGFKHGVPIDADLVFDVRFLSNPHYVEELRPKHGKDSEVKDYVMQFDETKQFLGKIEDLLTFLLPQYVKEGKTQLVIGVGCTGGRHRSVCLGEYLCNTFKNRENCQVIHRDIEKGG
jgi:UPF0042 nucleotide-binding protein